MKKALVLIIILGLCLQNGFVSYAMERENYSSTTTYDYSFPDTIPGQWIQAEDGRWWYKHNNGSYTKNGWEWVEKSWYYFDAEGWMYTGWLNYGLHRFYLEPSSGAMAMWDKNIGGTSYFFNGNGELSTTKAYNNKALYSFFGGGGDSLLGGGSVKWMLKAAFSYEGDKNTIKVTDRWVYLSHTEVGINPLYMKITHPQADRRASDYTSIGTYDWVKSDSIYEPSDIVDIGQETHWSPIRGDSSKNVFPINGEYGLSVVYNFGNMDLFTYGSFGLEGGRSSRAYVGGAHTYRPELSYKNSMSVLNETSSDNYEVDIELLGTIGALYNNEQQLITSDLIKNNMEGVKRSIASNSNATKGNTIIIPKEVFDLEYNLALLENQNSPQELTKERISRKTALLAEAMSNGYSTSDEEINLYIEKLKGELNLSTDPLANAVYNAFGSEEQYWEKVLENYRRAITTEKYFEELELEYYDKHNLDNTGDSERRWLDYRNEIENNIIKHYNIIFE